MTTSGWPEETKLLSLEHLSNLDEREDTLTLLQKFLERFLYFTIYFLEEYKNYVFVSTKSSLHYQESVYCRLSNACQLSTIEFQRVLALSWCPDCPRTNGRSNIIQAFSILFSPSIPNYFPQLELPHEDRLSVDHES
jgi:hypothetical protein